MEKDITQEASATPNSTGSSKLSTIFFVVLGLHVLIIIGIGAFHLLKGSSTHTQPVASTAEAVEPVVAQSAGAPNETQPAVETQGYPTAAYGQYAAYPVAAPAVSAEQAGAAPLAAASSEAPRAWNSSPAQSVVAASQSEARELSQPLMRAQQARRGDAQPVDRRIAAQPSQAVNAAQGAAPAQRVMRVPREGVAQASLPNQVQPQPLRAVASADRGYTVVKGDTLTRIAHKTHCRVQALRDVNSLKSDFLKIGQKLALPEKGRLDAQPAQRMAAGRRAAASAATQVASQPSAGGFISYKIVKGDTLVKIAKNHGTTSAKLAQINQINDPTKLRIGMELKVPAASQSASNKPAFQNTQAATPATKPFRTPASQSPTDMAMLRASEQQ